MKSHRILLVLGFLGLLALTSCKSTEKCPTYGSVSAQAVENNS